MDDCGCLEAHLARIEVDGETLDEADVSEPRDAIGDGHGGDADAAREFGIRSARVEFEQPQKLTVDPVEFMQSPHAHPQTLALRLAGSRSRFKCGSNLYRERC